MSKNKVVPGRLVIDDQVGLEIRMNRHPKRKNNLRVGAMYEAYKAGKSLEEIGRMYGVSRQSVYDVFQTRKYPLRSKQLEGLQIVDGIRFTLAGKKKGCMYLRGTLPDGRRVTMHAYVWEKHRGVVPPGYVIFHKDRNPENNTIENLEIIPRNKMARIFNPQGFNQFTSPNGSRRKAFDRIRERRIAAYSGND